MSRIRPRSRTVTLAVAAAGVLALGAACGSPSTPASGDGGGDAAEGGAPVQIGLITSTSGPLATYGADYLEGFEAGLDYATDGTGEVDGRPIEVIQRDDAGDPAKAVAEATDLIGQGVQILAGSASSGVATQVAPLAEQNDVLFISGPAATDALTGINGNTFRSGRQTYQDILTAQSFIGEPSGKQVIVVAQDSAFGQANVAAVTAVLGDKGGATVTPLLVPATATDFTPFASQARDAGADLAFVAWAGETAPAMWQAMGQQGVLESTTVVTGLDIRASYPTYGASATGIQYLSHFFAEAVDNEVSQAMAERVEAGGGEVDLFTPDGFTAAQMIVHAIQEGGDVAGMIDALEGWSFDGVKGELTIREEDHALLQPMFQARLEEKDGELVPVLVETLDPEQTAPPVAAS
jgi:branched-chain amino acid transport system substrate-binding protein